MELLKNNVFKTLLSLTVLYSMRGILRQCAHNQSNLAVKYQGKGTGHSSCIVGLQGVTGLLLHFSSYLVHLLALVLSLNLQALFIGFRTQNIAHFFSHFTSRLHGTSTQLYDRNSFVVGDDCMEVMISRINNIETDVIFAQSSKFQEMKNIFFHLQIEQYRI